ncbi:hypothetical protein [Methylococcus sp. EFPC2]|uniref:hypothetical protein n=1 Tax=Methylococcus sp. EFPC2 TaxID=2812648 RepID=UPI0019684232|nr:hypothetical protein [Methylococcus sp. EFPC2]QSA98192.1 hypothetical protein JWZ97_05075 [Methylococcus sp. EFPC2]
MKDIRADAFKVSADAETVSVLFGARQPGAECGRSLPVTDRIVLTRELAEALHARLGEALAEPAGSPSQGLSGATSPHGALPLPSAIEGGAEKARLWLAEVQGLGLPYGLEHSYKLLDKRLLRNRLLVGFRVDAGAAGLHEALCDLCRRLDMPQESIEAFAAQIGAANIVLFGFEENETTCLYKAYLEFGGNLKNMSLENPVPFQIHAGYKWDAFDNRRSSIARYTCHPLLSMQAIQDRLTAFYGEGRDRLATIARKLIARAAERVGEYEFIYAEVLEDGNPRHSYDINLYRANMRVSELRDILMEMAEYFRIPLDDADAAFAWAQDQIVGHLSGGTDRQGRDFLTVYFGAFGSSC